MANPISKEQKDFRNSWGVNPLKQRDETLVVLDGWHDWTFTRTRRNRHSSLPIVALAGLAVALCIAGASFAWM